MIPDGGRLLKLRPFSGLLLLALALIPFLILAADVVRYHVDVPFWDQWNFVPLLGKSYEEGVTFKDLWGQHNEHRLLFPRLIMLGLAHASRYNIAWELAVILLMAAASLALVWRQLVKTAGASGYSGLPWAVPAASLLIFTLGQAENWLWGWQIQIFLNVLAVIAGLCLLGGPSFQWRKFWCAVGLGILATYSFANGLIFWPLGFIALLLSPPREKRSSVLALAAWAASSAFIILSYFYRFRYDSPSGTPLTHFLARPGEYILYLLKYLGRPVINSEGYALAVGFIGLVLFGAFSFLVLRDRSRKGRAFLPFILFGLYSIGCGLLTGVGRVGFGSAQAMSGRYVPFSALIWVSDFAFLCVLSREVRVRARSRPAKVIGLAGIGVLSFVLVFGIARTSYRVGHRVFKSYHSRMSEARAELLQGEDEKRLLNLYIDADYVRRGTDVLRKHRLSVFREKTESLYSRTNMLCWAQMSFSSLGQTETVTSPR
jgi:hypothetical protein